MKRAIFPWSFDPLTLGHCEIINKAEAIFDEIIVAVGINNEKKYQFSIDQTLKFIENEFLVNPKIKVVKYHGLTVDYCKKVESKYIIRGLRNPGDFEFEKQIALFNNKLGKIETIFFLTSPSNAFISSSIVREIINKKGDYKKFVPKSVRF